MKIFLTIFIIIFNLQSLSKADDIRDFQIEGMSIGDSALDFYSEKEILTRTSNSAQFPKSNKFKRAQMNATNDDYDGIIINYKNNDSNYILQSISGLKYYKKSIKNCYAKMDEVKSEISKIFKNFEFRSVESKHRGDSSGKSTVKSYYYDFESGGGASIQCYDWSKELDFSDHLRQRISNKDFRSFLANEAY